MRQPPRVGIWIPLRRLIRLLAPSRERWAPWRPKRLLALALFVPVFLMVQLVHWVGFLLDDILFPAYRDVRVSEPLFVVGLPRSGTSYLQRVLAMDEGTTTMRLWEIVLAPSVTERKVALALLAADRGLGRPLGRLIDWVRGRALAWMDDVHPVDPNEPEEDFLTLLAAFACFLLIVPFPAHPELWRLTRFDEWDPAEREPLLSFYASCLQRHLYVVGANRRLLSKNPSFTPFARSLADVFPDARFLCCVRDPREAVPSQLSSVADGMRFFGVDVAEPWIRDRIVSMMERYADHALEVSASLPEDRWMFVPLVELREDLAGTVESAYARFGWTADEAFRSALRAQSREARRHRSTHDYQAEQFGLSSEELESRFAAFIERFAFDYAGSRSHARETPRVGT